MDYLYQNNQQLHCKKMAIFYQFQSGIAHAVLA
ncbi:hypothetical protein BB2000_2596 [Proteus mirabilis BB2000]|nr:hypothetical protein BB2000_2596 [Proteus mirabilis BB2000]